MVTRFSQLAVLSVIALSTASAQVQLGLQTGASYVDISAESNYPMTYRYTPILGYAVGIVCNVHLSEWAYVQAEPLYIQNGLHVEPRFDGGARSDELNDYIGLPILLKAEFGNSVIRPYLLVGPRLSLLLSATNEVSDPPSPSYRYDVKAFYHRFDFAFDFGGGAEYFVNPQFSLAPSVRYSLGLLNIRTADFISYARGFQFNLALLVKLNKG
jgi:Outer membrane protein beta-barrel domain